MNYEDFEAIEDKSNLTIGGVLFIGGTRIEKIPKNLCIPGRILWR